VLTHNNIIADGVFGRLIDMISSLPFKEKHTPYIKKLMNKNNPYLQEAGVQLATASVKQLNNHHEFEESLCLLLQKNIDPWVLHEINNFFRETTYRMDIPKINNFFVSFSQAAYNTKKEMLTTKIGKKRICRNMGIQPFKEAQKLIEYMIVNNYNNPGWRIKAVLPALESFYKMEGYRQMKKFLKVDNTLTT
jgi:hypothetical protein